MDWFKPRIEQSLLSLFVGITLLTAALAKAHALPRPPVLGTDGRSPGQVAIILVESGLGLWLLAGWRPVGAKRAAVGVFSLFLVLSLKNGVAGTESCGCFGEWSVNPWVMAGFDAAVVLLLVVSKPIPQVADRRGAFRTGIGTGGFLATLGLVGWSILHPATIRSLEEGLDTGPNQVIEINPARWVQGLAPSFGSPQLDVCLREGDWLIVFYRRDCPECQAKLTPALERLRRGGPGPLPTKLALVEVPSQNEPISPSTLSFGNADLRASLPQGHHWLVRTPLLVRARDGIVWDYSYSLDEAQLLARRSVGAWSNPIP